MPHSRGLNSTREGTKEDISSVLFTPSPDAIFDCALLNQRGLGEGGIRCEEPLDYRKCPCGIPHNRMYRQYNVIWPVRDHRQKLWYEEDLKQVEEELS